ncbi:hypothetical protein [Synechococcus sp. LTW-R]|uniref:hypothetical protein n=1 Tax=Synechococcus sp. LTW-R TaxID=2751170 RepID=UPI00162A2713|nr:hypothetical protein [Synechococcus sp. LTW-R]QNG30054.1 hypothetical protein H0O22_02540 [Synechococcus sp. LTW-R]
MNQHTRRNHSEKNRNSGAVIGSILIFSLCTRITLALRGGQFFFPDESRYNLSREAAAFLQDRNWDYVFQSLSNADHPLFFQWMLVPAALERLIGTTDILPSLYIALFSAGIIYATFKASESLSDSTEIALIAAFVASISTSLTIYSRHIVPYDISLFLGISSIAILASKRPTQLKYGMAGALCGLSFWTYTGYWALTACCIAAFFILRSYKKSAADSIFFLAGCAIPLGFVLLPHILSGKDFFRGLSSFSNTVTQGNFSEGWMLPFEYLHSSEGAIFYVFTVLIAWSCIRAILKKDSTGERETLILLVFIYLSLVLASVGAHKFVVYGRTCRQLLPLACISAAYSLRSLAEWSNRKSTIYLMLASATLFLYTGNISDPFQQVFPNQFVEAVRKETGAPLAKNTPGEWIESGSETHSSNEISLINAKYLYPIKEEHQSKTHFFKTEQHPINYRPYQYEGFRKESREIIRRKAITMRAARSSTSEDGQNLN